MDDKRYVEWNRPKLERFRAAYEYALEQSGNDGEFNFEGNDFVVSYACYLIQYLEGELPEEGQ